MNHFRLLGHLDTTDLLVSLHSRRREWDAITLRQDTPGSPHRDTRSIFLRGPEAPTPVTWFQDVPHKDYPLLSEWPEAQAILETVNAAVPGQLGKVMLIELKPGGALAWHIDQGPYSEQHLRLHLPVITNPGAMLYSGGEAVHLPVGLLTEFDNTSLHSAANFGEYPRVHLVIDVRKG